MAALNRLAKGKPALRGLRRDVVAVAHDRALERGLRSCEIVRGAGEAARQAFMREAVVDEI